MQKKDYIIQLLKYIIMAIVVGIIVGSDRCLVWKSADRNLRVQDHTLSIFTAIPANCWAGDHSNVLRIQ